ncbi:MAG: hypothetical protein JWQ76_1023, partial [Ramlibacter sp.]|nr:hypothetical protein [Ramlibacter sp.]
ANMASGRRLQLGCLVAAALMCGAVVAGDPYRIAQGSMAPASSSAPAKQAQRLTTPRGSSDQDCRLRWREYRRSQACFAPFITVYGIKAEAFQACGPELRDPSAECGPPPDP